MKNYNRVIPRDFFNEAKLLKCFGVLALKVLDCQVPQGINISIEESGEAFKVKLDQINGSLHIVNYPVSINGEIVEVGTQYNSKDNFPFYCYINYCEILIFDEDGNFSEEFIENFNI